MRECSRNALRTFLTKNFDLQGMSAQIDRRSLLHHSFNNLSLFLLNMDVLCVSYRQQLPFNVRVAVSHQTIRRVHSKLANLVQDASHNAPCQRPRWHLNGRPTK